MNVSLDKAAISRNARRVIDQLHRKGHSAYIVGGAVRDLVLGLAPKDFDVATSATPEEVRKAVRGHTRKIGRRFRIVHAYFPEEIIEISTFRKNSSDVVTNEAGRLVSDNVFGTAEEDAWRRDFTANALFFDPATEKITDHTGGLKDLEKRSLRIIGDPDERYCEDPVRMVRAVRLANKLSLKLEKSTRSAIGRNLYRLENVPSARLFDELTKVIKSGTSRQCFAEMERLGMMGSFFPNYGELPEQGRRWAEAAMMMTDRRQHQGETVSVSIVIASMYWPLLEGEYRRLLGEQRPKIGKLVDLFRQSPLHSCPLFGRRVCVTVTEMWETMARMETARRKRQIHSLRRHPALRMALAFLRLRAEFDEELVARAANWDEIAECRFGELDGMIARLYPGIHSPRRAPSRQRKANAEEVAQQ